MGRGAQDARSNSDAPSTGLATRTEEPAPSPSRCRDLATRACRNRFVARRLGLAAVVALALLLPASARADVGVNPTTKIVPPGGVIRGSGDGSGMAVYLVPGKLGPKRYPCHGDGICEPTARHAPGAPFTFLGRLRKTTSLYATQDFSFRVPTIVRPGLYRMYLYCLPCGRSLIQSGGRLQGETIRVTARPRSRGLAANRGSRPCMRPRVRPVNASSTRQFRATSSSKKYVGSPA